MILGWKLGHRRRVFFPVLRACSQWDVGVSTSMHITVTNHTGRKPDSSPINTVNNSRNISTTAPNLQCRQGLGVHGGGGQSSGSFTQRSRKVPLIHFSFPLRLLPRDRNRKYTRSRHVITEPRDRNWKYRIRSRHVITEPRDRNRKYRKIHATWSLNQHPFIEFSFFSTRVNSESKKQYLGNLLLSGGIKEYSYRAPTQNIVKFFFGKNRRNRKTIGR